MLDRRQFIGTGFSAVMLGLIARRATGAGRLFQPGDDVDARHGCSNTGAASLHKSFPIVPTDSSAGVVRIAGLPVVNQWFGDDFPNQLAIPFHQGEAQYPGGAPPEPSEQHDIVIIGGGLSGLAAAFNLRHRRPVVLELHRRFGGVSAGEHWNGTSFSLGSAYFISPDADSYLEGLYRTLGVDRLRRESPATDDPTEYGGSIVENFWEGAGLSPVEIEGFSQYRALLLSYVNNYPSIPLLPGVDNTWIRQLDAITLRQHIVQSLTVPVPKLLQAAIQGYCYSSFNAGWEEISAAAGWNFLAAEEYGRWVLPGGNAGLASLLFDHLLPLEAHVPANCPPRHLRSSCRAVEVRVLGHDNVRVVYKGMDEGFRTIRAKRVVIACPKHVARQILPGLATANPQRFADFLEVETRGYVVANVLLRHAPRRRFYDLFLLNNGKFPGVDGINDTPEQFQRATDAVNGAFNRLHGPNFVLTMYWPLPYNTGRFDLIADTSLRTFAERLRPELDIALSTLDLSLRDVRQVRFARWGHSMPLARPGLIASGVCERLRQPLNNHIFFVNQDNWALPAVETCLLEAAEMAPLVEQGL